MEGVWSVLEEFGNDKQVIARNEKVLLNYGICCARVDFFFALIIRKLSF